MYKRNTKRIGFSIEPSQNGAYWEAIEVYTITLIMHYFKISKEEIWEKRPSEINTLLEMIWYIKNPEWLKKYKELKFGTEFEFEQYLLNNMRFT